MRRTTCPYCGVGCGLVAQRESDGRIALTGDSEHPANHGRLCSKGSALADTLGLAGRLLAPEMRGGRVGWDTALDAVAAGFARTIAEHGRDAVAFYVSGQLLTEDYYVANKLMKGFIGSANIDTNSRLCMASSVAGHRRAFGSDVVPGCYEDLELADLIVLVGSNAAWCHPVLHQRLRARDGAGRPKVVVIDPRRTATCAGADLHLALRSGSDGALFNGLLAWLAAGPHIDRAFVDAHTGGFVDALAAARASAPSLDAVAEACGLAIADLHRFYGWFAGTERVVTLYSQGINQSSSGTDKVNAIINCHLATGRIGRPGMGPFSLTGQPNAMGGREVGGLANQLAAHLTLEDPAHRALVQDFWRAPRIAAKPGRKAVEMFDAIGRGEIKAVWIMATNPMVSLPDATRARAALAACPLVVVSDCVRRTDTAAFAHILLPAAAWGEKDGTVTNSERRISRQRAFMPPPGEAKPDWWIVAGVARRLGFGAAFDYAGPAEIFREHAALSGHANNGTRGFDISALAALDDAGYDRLAPVQWPVTAAAPAGTARLFGDGRFFTPDRRARFIAVVPQAPAHAPDADFPLVLNTGRSRDHWHTMTRTAKSPRLSAHAVEPVIDIHPADAAAVAIADGDLAQIDSRWGRVVGRANLTEAQGRGSVFAPIHWTDQFASLGRAGAAVNPVVDPLSGQPECKHTPVRLQRFPAAWHGFVLSREALEPAGIEWWARARSDGYWRHEIAGREAPADWELWARLTFGGFDGEGEWIAYRDRGARSYRFAALRVGRLAACLFVAARPALPPRAWLGSLFRKDKLSAIDRHALLTGQPPQAGDDTGPTVCSCHGVGRNRILAAIRERACTSVAAIGAATAAGTNCGSCKPELAALLEAESVRSAVPAA